MGRVLTGTYKKTYGQQIRGKKTSNYNCDKMICRKCYAVCHHELRTVERTVVVTLKAPWGF